MKRKTKPRNSRNAARTVALTVLAEGICLLAQGSAQAREMFEQPRIKLRSLEKTTARTMTFEADVGSTLKFGSLFIKVQSCQKSSPVDLPEAAAFLQIWEEPPESTQKAGSEAESEWVFSGWMFSSSPALSPMDHPIYDVWVLDCMGAEGEQTATAMGGEAEDGSGITDGTPAPPETKDFNSLLQGLTGVSNSAEPAEAENPDDAAESGGLQAPIPPAVEDSELSEDILEDETHGLPGAE